MPANILLRISWKPKKELNVTNIQMQLYEYRRDIPFPMLKKQLKVWKSKGTTNVMEQRNIHSTLLKIGKSLGYH